MTDTPNPESMKSTDHIVDYSDGIDYGVPATKVLEPLDFDREYEDAALEVQSVLDEFTTRFEDHGITATRNGLDMINFSHVAELRSAGRKLQSALDALGGEFGTKLVRQGRRGQVVEVSDR